MFTDHEDRQQIFLQQPIELGEVGREETVVLIITGKENTQESADPPASQETSPETESAENVKSTFSCDLRMFFRLFRKVKDDRTINSHVRKCSPAHVRQRCPRIKLDTIFAHRRQTHSKACKGKDLILVILLIS